MPGMQSLYIVVVQKQSERNHLLWGKEDEELFWYGAGRRWASSSCSRCGSMKPKKKHTSSLKQEILCNDRDNMGHSVVDVYNLERSNNLDSRKDISTNAMILTSGFLCIIRSMFAKRVETMSDLSV
jgi:hypothetical protein